MSRHVAIVGGGIIGLATAFELAGRGMQVSVLEARADFGAGATAAAIGGITPQSEAYCRGPLRYVATWSTNIYGEFLESISAVCDHDFNVLDSGQLQVALSDNEMNRIVRDLVPVWLSEGFETIVLDREETLEHEPSLGPAVVGSVLLPIEIAVDPPEIAAGLLAALTTLENVELRSDTIVRDIQSSHGRAEISLEEGAQLSFDAAIVTAGVESRNLIPEVSRGIYPMRGQGVEFQTGHHVYPLNHHVYAANGGPRRSAYMVPRSDGRVAAGVTYEPNVDSTEVDPDSIASIVEGLIEVCPEVGEWAKIRTWSGVRPASVDGIPFIGHVSDNVIVSAGHQGLGITLAPISAHLVAELLEKGRSNLADRERHALDICSPSRLQGTG